MKKITPESLCDLVYINDPQIAPNGDYVAFVRNSVDRSNNRYNNTIWLKNLRNDEPARPLTSGTKDSSPRWSEDGSMLGFVSGRDDKPQVFVLPMRLAGGEARAITKHPNGVQSFEWSPDGKRIAYIAAVRADERQNEDNTDAPPTPETPVSPKDAWDFKRDKEQRLHDEELRLDPRVLNRVPYRTGTTYVEDRYRHVYVIDVPTNFAEPNTAKAMRLTDGDVHFAQPTWSRDGATLFSGSLRDPDQGELFLYSDVVKISAQTRGEVKRLAFAGHTSSNALPSPDGKWLAMLHSKEDEFAYRNPEIIVAPIDTSGELATSIDLTGATDRGPSGMAWSYDSQYVYFALLDRGEANLWRAGVNAPAASQPTVEKLTHGNQEISGFDIGADGCVVFVTSTPDDVAQMYVREPDGAVRLLYAPNNKFTNEHTICKVEELRFNNGDVEIQGWVILPPDFDPTKKYPLIVQIHGGPHVMWSSSLASIWHEFQTMAQAGYVVFYCNPRGSDGYGDAFWLACRGNWGPGPMSDILTGLEFLVSKGYIDINHMCITGGSYGGYLTVWMIGHDQRFAAACSQRGVYNLLSMRNTTDIPFFCDREAGGINPWQDPLTLWQRSPMAHIENIRTPLLIEHSEQDFRVPIEQAEQLFMALKLRRCTVELVRWPREGHEISRTGEPRHRIERIRRIVEWFDKHRK